MGGRAALVSVHCSAPVDELAIIEDMCLAILTEVQFANLGEPLP